MHKVSYYHMRVREQNFGFFSSSYAILLFLYNKAFSVGTLFSLIALFLILVTKWQNNIPIFLNQTVHDIADISVD